MRGCLFRFKELQNAFTKRAAELEAEVQRLRAFEVEPASTQMEAMLDVWSVGLGFTEWLMSLRFPSQPQFGFIWQLGFGLSHTLPLIFAPI